MKDGLATLGRGRCNGQSVDQIAAAARMAGLFVPLDTLRRDSTFAGEPGIARSYQAASFLQYVDRVYGRNRLRALWMSGFRDSRKVLGISPDSLEGKWRGTLSNVTPKMSWTKWWTRTRTRGCA